MSNAAILSVHSTLEYALVYWLYLLLFWPCLLCSTPEYYSILYSLVLPTMFAILHPSISAINNRHDINAGFY